jgi:hypothetical protein
VRRHAALALLAPALVLLAPALAACGSAPPDLFEVQRSGQGHNATLDLVVNDGGSVTCNGREHPLNGDLLLRARSIARDIGKQAELGLRLPPGRGTVLAYRVRVEQGTVAFSDTSPHQPHVFVQLQQLTKDVSEDVCGLRR